jgi:hypothetical protein
MDDIVLATKEQIDAIAAKSDLGPTSVIYAMGKDLACIKTVVEMDPVYFDAESAPARRAMFIWGLETAMRASGAYAYYFDVPIGDDKWLHVVKTHGGEQISEGPVLRFKKVLQKV